MRPWHPLPAALPALVESTPGAVLLHDARRGEPSAISRLFLQPLRTLAVRTPQRLPGLFSAIESALARGHCAAGFFSYECGAAFEPAAVPHPLRNAPSRPDAATPLAWFGIYPHSFTFHHETGQWAGGPPPGLAELAARPPADTALHVDTGEGPTEEEFTACIERIHDWIRAGDVYQLNFTYPLSARVSGSPAALYARLCERQPAPYAAFLHWQPGRHILSLSPELFFRVDQEDGQRRITAQPMKGTAPRGRTTAEDQVIAEQLRHDEKNRAENVMIVDLLRNDLGRLCQFGSVQTPHLFAVERYPTLWQMTSTVTGLLRSGVGYEEMLRALFPCGSVTGAPKVRAMQLLAQLEARPRGVYTGAIGFFSPRRTVFNVPIRTLELDNGQGAMGVGSGIVIDSSPAGEFRECRLKAEFLTRGEESFSLVETLLWHNGFPLLDLHLDRIEDSAAYFDFPCKREALRAALLDAAAPFAPDEPRKVRLLLDADGALHIESEALPEPTSEAEPLRVCIAKQRTDPRDRFLYHKTTHRPLYARAFAAALATGFADVLFLNLDGAVTEGAISNLFVVKDGRWLTPPIACGLLPGVFRRHLLATRTAIEERVLSLDDLRNADAVYLANAVRGLRQVTVAWES